MSNNRHGRVEHPGRAGAGSAWDVHRRHLEGALSPHRGVVAWRTETPISLRTVQRPGLPTMHCHVSTVCAGHTYVISEYESWSRTVSDVFPFPKPVQQLSLDLSRLWRVKTVGVGTMTATLGRGALFRPDRRYVAICAHHLGDDPTALACTLPLGHANGCVYVGTTLDDTKHADSATQEDL